jgi:type II secretory pathway component GspD/PulD (secretin)
MKRPIATLFAACFALAVVAAPATTATQTRTIKPAYVSPSDLSRMLGVTETAGLGVLRWNADGADHLVTVRRNDSANLLVLEGEPDDVARMLAQAEIFDLPPRQISLEARIIEVDTDAAHDLGVDWSQIRTNASVNWSGNYRSDQQTQSSQDGASSTTRTFINDLSSGNTSAQLGASLVDALHLLEEKGAATYHDAPRMLTLNNQPATVLDGYRVTYVNRANGYANIYQTETMDAGLRLEVTPSLGESGYLKLDLEAELSNLLQVEMNAYTPNSRDFASISGSPIKRGQILRNTVMAKDGETVVLAGFTRTVDVKAHRKFPVLGTVLPFLFSRDMATQRHHESLIVITPRVVDLAGKLDERDKGLLEKH